MGMHEDVAATAVDDLDVTELAFRDTGRDVDKLVNAARKFNEGYTHSTLWSRRLVAFHTDHKIVTPQETELAEMLLYCVTRLAMQPDTSSEAAPRQSTSATP